MDYSKTLVMACATVIEEMLPLLPEGMAHQVFDFGLHIYPDKLRETLQEAIDEVGDQYETILLGYGLCSQAMVGIKANGCKLVVPRVDDCIAIFLGSRRAYNHQARTEPGSYYLTKGWIEAGDTPFSEYENTVEQYGKDMADRIYKMMMKNYKRLALINTGQYDIDKYRSYTQQTAEQFNLKYDEVDGSNALVKKLIFGPWDDEFVVIDSGETFEMNQFFSTDKDS